jgi:hypothetical protein
MAGSTQLTLLLVENFYQDFEYLPEGIDAIYYYSPEHVHVILFDERLRGEKEAQELLRTHLQMKINQKLRACKGMLKASDFEWYTSLEALGVMLKPRPVLPSPAARRVELPWVQMQSGQVQVQVQQQSDKENPLFGTIQADTTPSWFPPRTNAFK